VQAAEALDHAHQAGIVHRDVKPGNLLLDARGNLWVTDFGLAHVQHGEASLTMTGDLVGTLRYMSPEQALAKRVPIDHRTDVYSLGATLYELLTLRPAFAGKDRQELLRQIAFEEPAPPRRLDRAIPAELETIVLKALEKGPADRYATAQELADDLRRFLEDRPIRARRPSPAQRLRKWGRRHRAAVTAAALCLLVTVPALVGSAGWVLGDRAARRREAEDKVRDALAVAGPALRQGNPWDPALVAAAERASAQLHDGLVGPDLRLRAEQLRKDVRMLAELERIRIEVAVKETPGFAHVLISRTDPDRQYLLAFREYGIDLEVLAPEEAAVRVQGSAIREHLAAGLADLANVTLSRKEGEGQKAQQLIAIAGQADPDPWRNRLRQLVLSRSARDLEELARSAPIEELPATTLVLLGSRVVNEVRGPGPILDMLRRAQQRFPADFWINHLLAYALHRKAQPLRPEEAVGFYRVAVALRPQSPGARFQLADCLDDRGDKKGAIAEYEEAIRLKPDFAAAHNNLALVLMGAGQLDKAVACCEEGIRRTPDNAWLHFDLGLALKEKGDLEGAVAEYRRAIDLMPEFANTHGALGEALVALGRFAEARNALRRCLELLPQRHPSRQRGSEQLQQCEHLIELEGKLPAILSGKEQPADAGERAEYAELCRTKHLYTAAARLYQRAFADSPDLVSSPDNGRRYPAACAAALAGCGAGGDAARLTDAERAGLRKQGLDWLRSDLDAWRARLDKDPNKARPEAAQTMQHWLHDPDLAGVRDPEALARLPEAEREGWRKLWADVADTLARAQDKAAPQPRKAAPPEGPKKD
jgi:tetratricopeptide (TPR) repeat protein